MKIKHLPNNISPFENFGYSRIPEKPIEGDDIQIQCRLEQCNENNIVPVLNLVVNNVKISESMIANYMKSDDKGDYYSFSIGSYKTGDILRYQFYCQTKAGIISTDWYDFEIYQICDFQKPERIYFCDNSLILHYTNELYGDFPFVLNLTSDQIMLRFNPQNIKTDEKDRMYSDKEWCYNRYLIKLEVNPFSLSILNSSKDTLMNIDENDALIRLLTDQKKSIKNIVLKYQIKAKGLFGFGEKFNQVNQLGLEAKNYVYEHFTHQQERTYLPVPFFFTDAGLGMFFDTDYPVNFTSKQEKDSVQLSIDAAANCTSELDRLYLFFGEPQEMLFQYLAATGKVVLPPKWSFGPWMSANGWNTQKETLEQIDYMKQYQIPATVLVLEAWSDEATFYLFNDTKYTPKAGDQRLTYQDMSFDENGKWPNPKEMTKILHDNNVKLVLWQIPALKPIEEGNNVQHTFDVEYVIEKGYCVMDKDQKPFRIPDKWFPGSIVPDFTNREVIQWWNSKRQYLLDEVGVDGFKTDGGEFIYDNQSVFSNHKTGEEMRNPYPNLYLEAYQELLDQNKGSGERVLFSRAGYKGAQKFPIHWAGDQMSEYEEFRSQIKAGLSAGLSGVIFWGFDIAGFAGDLPTTDLFLRSTAMAAFSPVMQFHAEPRTGQFFYEKRRSWNNDRSPWNMARVNNEPWIMEIYRKYANIRMNLMPYIYNEAIYCSDHGRPMFAHLILDYPRDEKVYHIEDEYLFGRSILVAPVIEEGCTSRSLYLPQGTWYDFFTGEKFAGGTEFNYNCPLGEIPVFVKEGHAIAMNLADSRKLADFIGNDLNSYRNFAIKLFGEIGSYSFKDDLGNDFVLKWNKEEKIYDGKMPKNIIIL